MILDIDCGNSYLKWRFNTDSQIHKVSYPFQPQILWGEMMPKVTQVRVVSVVSEAYNQQIIEYWLTQKSISVEFAQTTAQHGQLRNAYQQTSQLGVDRWVAMIAAWQQTQGACLVIDSGTTTTIDAIDAQGQHLGGYIVPGLHLLQRSLELTHIKSTALAGMFGKLSFGDGTALCIEGGCLQMTCGLIIQSVEELKRISNLQQQQIILHLAGGSGGAIVAGLANNPSLVEQIKHNPLLVLDGLAICM